MNVAGHAGRDSPALDRAAEKAQSVIRSENIIPGGLGLRDALIFTGILGFGAVVAAARYYNVPTSYVMAQRIATENSLTYYSTVAGVGGFVGSIIASNRLANVNADTVTVGSMAAPVLVTFLGNVVAGFLFPAN